MRSLLLDKLQHHQQHPSNFYRYSESLRGAAALAREVASRHDDQDLLTAANDVLLWIDTRGDDLAEEDDVRHRQHYERMDATRAANKALTAVVRGMIGMEHLDERWLGLVNAYVGAFPTFRVRDSVYERLSPRKRSARLRTRLCALVHEMKLSRIPNTVELEKLFPQALQAYEEETLTYLERALPGYDFRAEWNRQYGGER